MSQSTDMPEFVVKVSDIDEEGAPFERPLSNPWLDQAFEHTGVRPGVDSGDLHLFVHRSGQEIVIAGRVTAPVVLECARCLGDVSMPLVAEVQLAMKPRNGEAPSHVESGADSEEEGWSYFHGDEIALDSILRELLILEIPMQPHCDEPECVSRWSPAPAEAESASSGAEQTAVSPDAEQSAVTWANQSQSWRSSLSALKQKMEQG
ncbi:MAG: DUF177 domain-containing protein [Myxococcota bacterium]